MLQAARTVFFFLALAGIAMAADLPASGILITCEPPSTYVELIRYNEIRERPVIWDIILCSKSTRQIRNGAVMARFDYPEALKSPLTREKATATIASAQEMAAKYPQYRAQLTDVANRWQTALSTIKAATPKPVAKSGPAPKRSMEPKLTVSKATYFGVKVIGLEDDLVKIEHVDGVSRFEIVRLTQDEIDAINAIAGGPVITPADVARAKANAEAALAMVKKETPSTQTQIGARPLSAVEAEIARSEAELKRIRAQMIAEATAAAKRSKATPSPQSRTSPARAATSAGPSALDALLQKQQAAELRLAGEKQQLARLQSAPPPVIPAPTAPAVSAAVAAPMVSTAPLTRGAGAPTAPPAAGGTQPGAIAGTAPARVVPAEPDLGIPQASRPEPAPVDLADAKACYRELAELATGPVVVNGAEGSRRTVFGRYDDVVDTLDWVVRAQHLRESSDPAFVKTVQKVRGIYLDLLRLHRWADDFGQPEAGLEPDLLRYMERNKPANLSADDKQVAIYRDGHRSIYTDQDTSKSVKDQLQGAKLSKYIELAQGILLSQLEAVWTEEILPRLASKSAAANSPLISIAAPPKSGGPAAAAIHSKVSGADLEHCVLALHLTDDLGHRTSWFGYFPKIAPADALMIQTGGIELAALNETSSTIKGEYAFYSDEGAEPSTVFSWPLPAMQADPKAAAERNGKMQASLSAELDAASALIVRARQFYRPPADPISARAKLVEAIKPGQRYTAYGEDGRPAFSFICGPFDSGSATIKAESESSTAGGKASLSLIGRFEEEVTRGCVLAFAPGASPASDELMAKRFLWLVTEPRELWRLGDFHGNRIAACPYVVYMDPSEGLAVQRLGGGNQKIISSPLRPETEKK